MARTSQNLEYRLGAHWVIEFITDRANLVDAGVEFRLDRFGEHLLSLSTGPAIAIPDPNGKTAYVTVLPVEQEDAGLTAGVHEYFIRVTQDGATTDEASGVLYVRD